MILTLVIGPSSTPARNEASQLSDASSAEQGLEKFKCVYPRSESELRGVFGCFATFGMNSCPQSAECAPGYTFGGRVTARLADRTRLVKKSDHVLGVA